MSFSRQVLVQVREQAVQTVIEANAQIADIDQTLAILDGAAAAPAPPYDNGGHFEVGTVYVTQQGPAEPVLSPEVTAELKEFFNTPPTPPVPATPEIQAFAEADAPKRIVPRGPLGDHDDSDELTFTAPPAPEAKTGGRRTNEEIAAEVGVNLEDVKEWKGGGRVSRADMEEFKKLHPAAIPGQQTIDDVAQEWTGSPVEDVKATAEAIKAQSQADYEADLQRRAQAEGPSGAEQTEPDVQNLGDYVGQDEAFVADDAETFEPPF